MTWTTARKKALAAERRTDKMYRRVLAEEGGLTPALAEAVARECAEISALWAAAGQAPDALSEDKTLARHKAEAFNHLHAWYMRRAAVAQERPWET